MVNKVKAKVEAKKKYEKPTLRKLGNMAQVTKKSGGSPDMQQNTKPGGGGG